MAKAAEEDFSFPATTTDSPPPFIESPPLWRHPPPTASTHREKPEKVKGKDVEHEEKFKASSSMNMKRESSFHDDDDEEDKMDMLWEDLNDEFSRRSCGKKVQNSDISSPGREVQISCVKALKLSKANGHIFSGKKPSILVFIKVLKKVFRMQNSHRTIKKRPWKMKPEDHEMKLFLFLFPFSFLVMCDWFKSEQAMQLYMETRYVIPDS